MKTSAVFALHASLGPEHHHVVSLHYHLQVQRVVATASLNFSDGVIKPRVLRGRPLS
jgi:hypothetical protein